jgi:hypothetical protein
MDTVQPLQLEKGSDRDSRLTFRSQRLAGLWLQHPFRYGQLRTIRQSYDYDRGTPAPQISNEFDDYSVLRMMRVANLAGVEIMSSTRTPCAIHTPHTCWKLARISARFSFCWVTRTWSRPLFISISRIAICMPQSTRSTRLRSGTMPKRQN